MFKAIGVGVVKDGPKYRVKVDYFDTRVNPNTRVTTVEHLVATKPELLTAVNAQLVLLRDADLVASLNADVQGAVLGTI